MNAKPNLLVLAEKITECIEEVTGAQQSINFKRANFANQQAQSEENEQKIIAGLMRLAGPDAPKSLRATLTKEFQIVRKPNHVDNNSIVDDLNKPKKKPAPQFVVMGSSKQQAIDRQAMDTVLRPICKLFGAKGVMQKEYLKWLNDTFKDTALKFYAEKVSDGMFSSHYVLKYELTDGSSDAMKKIAETVSAARLAIARGDHIMAQQAIDRQILAEQSPLLGASKGEIAALRAMYTWMNDGKDLETAAFERLMRAWIGYAFLEPKTSTRFKQMASRFMPTYCLLPFVDMFKALDEAVRQAVMAANTFDEAKGAVNKILTNVKKLGHYAREDDWDSVRRCYADNVLEPLLKDSFQCCGEYWPNYISRAADDKRNQAILLKELQTVFANPATTAEKMRTGFVAHDKMYRTGTRCGRRYFENGDWRESNHVWKRTDGWQPGGLKYAAAQARIGVGLQEYQWGCGAMLSISDEESLNQAFTNAVIRIQNISTNGNNAPAQLIKELEGLLALQNKKGLDHDRYDRFMEAIVQDIGLIITKSNNTKDINIKRATVDDDNNGKKKKPLDANSVKSAQKNIFTLLSTTKSKNKTITGNTGHDFKFKHQLTKLENTARKIGNRKQVDDINLDAQSLLVIMENKAKDYENEWRESNKKREEEMRSYGQEKIKLIKDHLNELKRKDDTIESIKKNVENYERLEPKKNELIKNMNQKISQFSNDCDKLKNDNIKLNDKVDKFEKANNLLQDKQAAFVKLLRDALLFSLKTSEKIIDNCDSTITLLAGVDNNKESIQTVDDNDVRKSLGLNKDNEKWAMLGVKYGANLTYKNILNDYIKKIKMTVEKNKKLAEELGKAINLALDDGKIIEKEIAEIKSTAKEYLYNIKTQIKSQNKFIIFLQSKVKQLENENVELAKTIKQQSKELAETKARFIESEKEKNILIKQHSENMKKVNESNINNINKMQNENMRKTKVLMDKYLNHINDLENKVQFQDKKKQNKLDELSNELALSKKREAIQIKVKEATKKEWYPGYSKAGKVGAFLVDFVLVIPPIMNLLGWILSGFGFAKNFRTIMQEKAGNDYEQQLMCIIRY